VYTETFLRDWRMGQVSAERLCAGLLRIGGYSDVDPQAALGGPEGKKESWHGGAGRNTSQLATFRPRPSTYRYH
jgi:hypothetical protein